MYCNCILLIIVMKLSKIKLVGIFISFACQSISQNYYSIDPSNAYKWQRAFPQSCQCAENQVPSSSCELYQCLCTCDITAGKCDFNCCCDPDCSQDQTNRFSTLGVCSYEGHVPDSIQYCYSSVDLYGVHPSSPLGGESTSQYAVGQALCVDKLNVYLEQDYFTNTELQSSSIFSQSDGQKPYSYIPSSSESTEYQIDSQYDQNDTMPVFYNSQLGLIQFGAGYFQIPTSDFTGLCNDQNYAKFEVNINSGLNSCSRQLSGIVNRFISQCEQSFSVANYVTNIWISKNANQLSTADYSQVVNIQVAKVQFRDFYTGNLTDITSKWVSLSCHTQGIILSTTSAKNSLYTNLLDNSISCSEYSSSQSVAKLVESSTVCQSFVQSVTYQVNHGINSTKLGEILQVTANVIVSDIPIQLNNLTTTSSESDETAAVLQDGVNNAYGNVGITITQQFGVSYFSTSNSKVSKTNGNIVRRMRSGNPGYIQGSPVLFGILSPSSYSVNNVIAELIDGLTIATPFSNLNTLETSQVAGSCPSSSQSVGKLPIEFGYDVTTGCILNLNHSQLIDICCTGASGCTTNSVTSSIFSDPLTGIPYFLNFQTGYIGIFGSADPLDITQWFEMTFTTPTTSRTWSDSTSTCYNMFTGLTIQFLVAYSGERTNPQNKIVSALATLYTSDWTLNIAPNDTTRRQNFPLSLQVSFIYTQYNDLQGYAPPGPPALFSVPYDVFYPFLASSGVNYHISSSMKLYSLYLIPFLMVSYFFN